MSSVGKVWILNYWTPREFPCLIFSFLIVLSCSVMSWLFATPWTVARQAPLSMGILQTRLLEWVAMSSSRGSSQPRDQIHVSRIAGRRECIWATREARFKILLTYYLFLAAPGLCCRAWASHCGGFSCCREQAPGSQASVVVSHGLSCPAVCRTFPDQGSNLCPLHWQVNSFPRHHQGSPGVFLKLERGYGFGEPFCLIRSGGKCYRHDILENVHLYHQGKVTTVRLLFFPFLFSIL